VRPDLGEHQCHGLEVEVEPGQGELRLFSDIPRPIDVEGSFEGVGVDRERLRLVERRRREPRSRDKNELVGREGLVLHGHLLDPLHGGLPLALKALERDDDLVLADARANDDVHLSPAAGRPIHEKR
jgi:hypothetical protein